MKNLFLALAVSALAFGTAMAQDAKKETPKAAACACKDGKACKKCSKECCAKGCAKHDAKKAAAAPAK
jgi:hypothetical protein